MAETVFLTVTVWALPSQVVFIGMVGSGGSLPAVALAVALSGMRFLPMVMAWTPVIRGPRTSRTALLFLSLFVAVTAWVFAMARLPDVPRPARAHYFAGFGMSLVASTAVVMALAYRLIGDLSGYPAAALVFLTPVYFLLALFGAARVPADRWALGAGLVLGPAFTVLVPEADILLAGLIGGTLVWSVRRARRRRP
jgi:predicted branched-subunit amino acid permease